MSMFKKAVQELVRQETRGTTHSVMGYIPKGTEPDHWTTTVRIPHPHGGIHPTGEESTRCLEFKNVPMPYTITGVIVAIKDMFWQVDRQVSVGFRGGSLTEPYIIEYQSPLHEVDDKNKESTPNRNGVVQKRATQAGGCHTAATASPAAQQVQQQINGSPAQQVVTNRGSHLTVQQALALDSGWLLFPPAVAAAQVERQQQDRAQELADPLERVLSPRWGLQFRLDTPAPLSPGGLP